MLRKIFYTVFLLFIFSGIIQAQVSFTLPSNATPASINYEEYFIDADPGIGSGTSIPVTSSTDATVNNYSVNLNAVTSGVHRIYFRTRDSKGAWSHTNVQTFFKLFPAATIPSNPVVANITKVEYFIDTDPGFGKGTSIPISASIDVTANNASPDITGIATGVHRIYFRTQDANGSWSLTNVQTFFVANVAASIPANPLAANIVKMEYFIDTDPGFGNGKPIAITSSADVTASNVPIDLSGLSNGVHRIYIRTQDANGSWSETNLQTFNILMANVVIPPNPTAANITKLEYFFDTDPGFGKATAIVISPTTDLSNYNFVADISSLKDDSVHTLYIRTFDDWSLTNTQTFVKGTLLPLSWISFNAKAGIGKVVLNWLTAHEINNDHFDIERSSDGEHFKKVGAVEASRASSAENNYAFTDEDPLNGISFYRLKQVDIDGHSSYSIVISVKLNKDLSVKIIQNPVHANLILQVNGTMAQALPLSIMDVSGKRIKMFSAQEGLQQINVNEYSAGMYYLNYQVNGNNFSIPFNKQ